MGSYLVTWLLWEQQGSVASESREVKVQRTKDGKAFLECKVINFLEYAADHLVLVGRVVHAQAEEGGLDETKPLLHD